MRFDRVDFAKKTNDERGFLLGHWSRLRFIGETPVNAARERRRTNAERIVRTEQVFFPLSFQASSMIVNSTL